MPLSITNNKKKQVFSETSQPYSFYDYSNASWYIDNTKVKFHKTINHASNQMGIFEKLKPQNIINVKFTNNDDFSDWRKSQKYFQLDRIPQMN